MTGDTQLVEAIGQGLVITQFLRDGYEVARPIRDNGIDLVVYRTNDDGEFEAHPVQIKVASKSSFGIWKKYERIPGIWFVFAWDIGSTPTFFRLTYAEAMQVAVEMGWTTTKSWTEGDAYVNNQPGEKLRQLLTKHEWSAESEAEPSAVR